MEKISNKKIILPIAIVLLGIMATAIVAVNSITRASQECREIIDKHNACVDNLNNKSIKVAELQEDLETIKKDIQKYDSVYDSTATQAQELEEELKKKQNATVVYKGPARAVPDAESFSKAARLELMLERLEMVEDIHDQDYVSREDLKTMAGWLYILTLEFKNTFTENGQMISLNDEGLEMYRTNNDHLKELENIYFNFEEYTDQKLKKRLGQLLLLQRNVVRGMQQSYFLG